MWIQFTFDAHRVNMNSICIRTGSSVKRPIGCVSLAVSFSGFHLSRSLICCTDWTVMLISNLLWGICSSLDSRLLATAVKVSKSCHESTTKPLILNSPILFQDNTAIILHCMFQFLIISDRCDMWTAISQNDWLTHSQTHNYCKALGLHWAIITVHQIQCTQ